MGFLFNFVVFICTFVNSPLATSVTGNIKDCLATLLGFLLFDDAILQLVNVLGIVTSLIGGMIYSYAKLNESRSLAGGSSKLHRQSGEKAGSLKFLEHLQRDDEKKGLLHLRNKEKE